MKKIFLFMFLIVICAFEVNAEACDAYDIKRLKEIADGVEITYELQEPFNFDGMVIYDRYKINVIGLTNEIILVNKSEFSRYNVDTNFDEVIFQGGKKTLNVVSVYCGVDLKKIYLELPAYNIYSNYDECKQFENSKLKVCQKWIDDKITKEDFYSVINSKKVIEEDLFSKYSVFIISGIVVLVIFVLAFFIRKKKEVLK